MIDLQTDQKFQYLRFQVGGEDYAIDVLKSREVLFLVKITPLPSSLDFLPGVINLRGSVIPVVDLGKKFRLATRAHTEDTAIIIVDVSSQEETILVGALVEAVRGVMRCDASELEDPPPFGMQVKPNLIKAIANKDGQYVVILDTDEVFSEAELWRAEPATTQN